MATVALTTDERAILAQVLELRPDRTRRDTPALQPLSLYSTELKGTKQIAGLLAEVRTNGILSTNPRTRGRYFNTLWNQGLVEGSAAAPKLTEVAPSYLLAFDSGTDDDAWRGAVGESVELEVIRALVDQMRAGKEVSEAFLRAWYGAQTFFDQVPADELDAVLADLDTLLFLFRINSAGWEIARYFRLSEPEREDFRTAFDKVLPTDEWTPVEPIEVAAAQYKDAADQYQSDVRFRISGFLKAYRQLRTELGKDLPRLDRQLSLRSGGTVAESITGAETGETVGASTTTAAAEGGATISITAPSLNLPRQLIVTGCPGSGKSYYINRLIDGATCTVFRTQFHPESSYFDFIGAYKPYPVYEHGAGLDIKEADGRPFVAGRPLIDYRFVPGPLMRGLLYAYQHPDENVIVLIEEINRGNPAAILGDMLQLLDRDEDGTSRYEVIASTELHAYFAAHGVAIESVRLPGNLYLWATMNSADQGVFPLDTAFRRRWSYVYKGYSEPCGYSEATSRITYDGKVYRWDEFRAALNRKLVELGIHEDKLVGPYFLTESQLADPASVLEKLYLYLWDDVLRFRQDLLFHDRSFSEVSDRWAHGAGAPLKAIELPAPIPEPAPEAATPAGASTEGEAQQA